MGRIARPIYPTAVIDARTLSRCRLNSIATAAIKKNTKPSGPVGGMCMAKIVDSKRQRTTKSDAPAFLTAYAAAITLTTQPSAPSALIAMATGEN